jgi:hypothetical protein
MAIDCIAEIPGAVELSNWFGGFPSFHDANADLQINCAGTGWLKAFGFRVTDKVDEKGFFVLEKHFAATFFLDEIQSVSLTDFLPGLSILYGLDIKKSDEDFVMTFDSSYGMAGSIVSRRIRLEFEPGARP